MEFLEATWDGDESKVAELVEYAHDQAGNKTYHDETALKLGIQLAYDAARRKYLDRFEHDQGNILVIGINYNRDLPPSHSEYKHHSCKIERW